MTASAQCFRGIRLFHRALQGDIRLVCVRNIFECVTIQMKAMIRYWLPHFSLKFYYALILINAGEKSFVRTAVKLASECVERATQGPCHGARLNLLDKIWCLWYHVFKFSKRELAIVIQISLVKYLKIKVKQINACWIKQWLTLTKTSFQP